MPVRKIPKSYRSVTGYFPSIKNGRSIAYESKLERDFFLMLEFDRAVVGYEEQPFHILGTFDGKKFKYTPDCLVSYAAGQPLLIAEVKFLKELEEKADEFRPKFDRAEDYARQNGMEFRVFTESDIRGDFLDNCKILYGFARPPGNLVDHAERIRMTAVNAGEIEFGRLLEILSSDKMTRAVIMPVVWHLIFRGDLVIADMYKPINNNSILRTANGNTHS
ncbi:MAG: heteromeric transposase endonuclease subunit TnsA [Geobacter sp.]|nr:MAG: heteromeric transposase endonuclease subunit TnsA [Geobacter sp.]